MSSSALAGGGDAGGSGNASASQVSYGPGEGASSTGFIPLRGGAGGGDLAGSSGASPAPAAAAAALRPRTVVPEHRMNKFYKILAEPVVREGLME